ncbi:MAG: hypothetical protein P8Y97_21135 [Candidatus Lokiarchaeota archaeon]
MSYILIKLEEKGLLERLSTRPLQIKISQKGHTKLNQDIENLKIMIPELNNDHYEISNLYPKKSKYLNHTKFIDTFIRHLREKVGKSLDSISQFLTKENLEELREDILEVTSNQMFKIFNKIRIIPKYQLED